MKRRLEFRYTTEQAFSWDDMVASIMDIKNKFGDSKKFAVQRITITPGYVEADIILVEPDEPGASTFFEDILKRWNTWRKKKK